MSPSFDPRELLDVYVYPAVEFVTESVKDVSLPSRDKMVSIALGITGMAIGIIFSLGGLLMIGGSGVGFMILMAGCTAVGAGGGPAGMLFGLFSGFVGGVIICGPIAVAGSYIVEPGAVLISKSWEMLHS